MKERPMPDWKQGGSKWSEVREYLIYLHEGVCVYCGIVVHNHLHGGTRTKATIDHVIPKSKGGVDDLRNLTLACCACNSSKGARV